MSRLPLLLAIALMAACSVFLLARPKAPFPDPAADILASAVHGNQTAVLGGGCFWGVQGVYERVKGVVDVVAGYAGGEQKTAEYQVVETGRTGHAESVDITYAPTQITYGQILKIFFSVVHDPTELNRQGPDWGTQYRSVIFYLNDDQKRVAEAYIKQLNDAQVFKHKIVTQVVPFHGFYPAEAYHQHYLDRNPNAEYIVYNDIPKLLLLKKEYPAMCKRSSIF